MSSSEGINCLLHLTVYVYHSELFALRDGTIVDGEEEANVSQTVRSYSV